MIYLKQPTGIGYTEVYLAVSHGCHELTCDSCDLRGDCHRLFENGMKCDAIKRVPKHRWARIGDEDIKKMKES